MPKNASIFQVVTTVGLAGLALCFATIDRPSGAYRSGNVHGVHVRGSGRFFDRISEALELVRSESPGDIATIAEHIEIIESGDRSGMHIARATCVLAPATAFRSLTWCAGALAHEAHHARLARRPFHSYGLAEEERACIDYQMSVMEKIGAPRSELDHLDSMEGTHFDMDGDGRYTWADYNARDW